MKFSRSIYALLAGGTLSLAACVGEPAFNGTIVDPVLDLPELRGTNWDGQPFTTEQLSGKVAVLFFGYTYCPDVCPLTLAKMKQLESALGDQAAQLEIVFVSVDPDRDSVEKLAAYVPNFDESFYGLHLAEGEIEVTQEALSLAVQYGQPKDGPGTDSFYYVDHTGSYFVVDRTGHVRLRFSPTATAAEMLPDIERLIAEKSA